MTPIEALASGGWTTRFAPAPTGHLHLGHVVNAIHVWGLAQAHGGRVLVRFEDHDLSRAKPEYERSIIRDIEWLGFGAETPPVRQSERHPLYERALARLAERGLVYVCQCSRQKLEVSEGAQETERRYPGHCRDLVLAESVSIARRIRFERCPVTFHDLRLGDKTQVPSEQCGDLLARDRNGNWTYQFAVVVDDIEQGIDVVIRGEDLLPSVGRQIQLAQMLGRSKPPQFLHHRLITHPDGVKLSKSNGDEGIRELREKGFSPERVIGLAASRAGLVDSASELSARELGGLFSAAGWL